jgi:hypothetical protein
MAIANIAVADYDEESQGFLRIDIFQIVIMEEL